MEAIVRKVLSIECLVRGAFVCLVATTVWAQAPDDSMRAQIEQARESHWAFKPVTRPEVDVSQTASENLDSLVSAKLKEVGLRQSSSIDKRRLLRRATYDLIGLPPTMEEVEAFSDDRSAGAFERIVDRLLNSPRFGERWARFWLDLARYSDTKGYVFDQDRNFAFSHTYRDYVIRAFNEDLPYDTFLMHQLAADQMDLGDDKRPLAAMGYLTLNRHFIGNIHDIIDDRIDVVTRGMLGLTVTCARCHEHKYDPIPAADYYSLYGVFRSSHQPGELPLIEVPDEEDETYQEFVKMLNERETALTDFLDAEHVKVVRHARAEVAAYVTAGQEMREVTERGEVQAMAKERSLHWQLVERWRDYLKGEDRAENLHEELLSADEAWRSRGGAYARRAMGTSPTKSSASRLSAEQLEARAVLYEVTSPGNVTRAEVEQFLDIPTRDRATRLRVATQRVKATHAGRPDRAMVMLDNAKPFDPYVFERGQAGVRGEAVPRQFLAVLSGDARAPFSEGSGRLELAKAIANPQNPLTARVFVNRVWMKLMAQPLVDTPSDFGLRSDAPTHPELLDYLASEFMNGGWSMKELIRTIVMSDTYQQDSELNRKGEEIDPENRLLWRQNRKRLEFEAMRDSFLRAADAMDFTMGGPSVQITREPFTTRRSIYSRVERQNLPPVFRTFDFAGPDVHSPKRVETTVPQQALFLMNSPFMVHQARTVLEREELQDADSVKKRNRVLYSILFQRKPTGRENNLARAFIEGQGVAEGPEPAAPSAWDYGYGHFDAESERLVDFTPLPLYKDRAWRGGEAMPDDALGWTSLTRDGGHTGRDAQHAAIRRWVAPYAASIRFDTTLRHSNENGDGIQGYIVQNGSAILWSEQVHNGSEKADLEELIVAEGDTIDFIASPNETDGYDSFRWIAHISVQEQLGDDARAGGRALEWQSRTDFSGPPEELPDPLTAWEEYAQALMLTNEFMFVD